MSARVYRVELVGEELEVTPVDGSVYSIPLAQALAAPDLFAACEIALTHLEARHDNNGNDWYDAGAAEAADVLEEAIAKARGGG